MTPPEDAPGSGCEWSTLLPSILKSSNLAPLSSMVAAHVAMPALPSPETWNCNCTRALFLP
eukprot:CAMPEP_0204239598 /NCGR_PEP_ID=MMETSP0361-20130328/94460_1 /ASSEMBLY_ACC=CAM_ASM_000343 /TAXON_ID=268821 /ORGANISM="Scrippsiella Hangoei, Strain SHTV-5" /LENGTH=60 /DNA_ID=CAMNT_0051212393 /DNA_START=300 /DNA_END=479 /DNA_ORIENTATION=+